MSTLEQESNGLKNWSTRDIMVLVAIVLVLAVVSAISAYLRVTLEAALGPLGNRMTQIIATFVLMVPPYLLRKPLAAVIASVLVGLVLLPFSPFGLISMVGYLIGGVIIELIFAAGRYRSYSLSFLLIGGVVYHTITLGLIWVPQQVGALGTVGIISMVAATIIGGLVAGWLVKLAGDGIAQSGVLTNLGVNVDA